MAALTFYHKPTCSKSREAKKLLDAAGADYETVLYIDTPPTVAQLKRLADCLDGTVKDMIRPKEAKEAGWDGAVSKTAIVSFLAKHPEAMQRPILFNGKRAVIGRPTENLNALL